MRRLLRMSLEGFKTFAGRTEIDLGPGLTAIVGPNGSGKSNLIDAIAWAVGDRSCKSLRGEGMEDLLFHGDDRRPPAALAQVTLAFANEDRLIGIDFSEVTVTRELRRGEGSRMLLNGVEAKLKDVQTLLSGTGLVGGFSLIRQGVVDRLVLAGPAEVGRWLEESANISGYRLKKQDAVERLRKVEANALEAERKRSSLRRELGQVRARAIRVRERRDLEERRRRLEADLAAWERSQLEISLARQGELEREIRARAAELEKRRLDLIALRGRLQQELAGFGALSRRSASPEASDLPRRVEEIRGAAASLGDIASGLEREGCRGWKKAAKDLDQVASTLDRLRAPGAPTQEERSARAERCLSELKECADLEEETANEGREETARLTACECERARLGERLAALGAASSEVPASVDPVSLRRELEDALRGLAELGPVDETAESREKEIQSELDALAPALEDLTKSRATLLAFIRQIEAYTSQLFSDTRAKVEARFQKYCALLFEGGDARLAPIEPPAATEGDPFPSGPAGLDVRVKLPRKPETALTLLSGGERTLAGLALVLALAAGEGGSGGESGRLLILDEVDAALDETNAARLALLLRDLEQRHQILSVTHNRLTMHQASHLLGVTSGASAASSLLKVRLERPESAA